MLRTLELPPVTDAKELAAAVNFQAQEQVPMPLNNAVLDFQALGVINTPAGPRQQVVLVAAQRDMVERLLGAIEQAGLIPVGIDLSAFALIRSLYAPETDTPVEGEEGEGVPRVLYLNVDGLTNLAIAEGPGMPLHPRGRRRHRVDGGRARRQARDQHPGGPGAAVRRQPRRSRRSRRMGSARLAPQPVPEMTPAEAVADEHPPTDPGSDFDGAPAPAPEYQGEPAEGQFAAPEPARGLR